jgi:peptidoglycan/xylan/chitin deacetylase (PgdA/CDA1 family)
MTHAGLGSLPIPPPPRQASLEGMPMNVIAGRVAAGILAALLATEWTVSASTRVVITVDVESNEAFSLPAQIDAVCQGGTKCGLMEIARWLRERGWSGTFFLNVYEHRKWGEPALKDVAVRLQDAGLDVALHTHPHWAYDPARWGMYQYSLAEQTDIVRDGVRLLQSWTGRPVVAHRTGAYAANEDTLTALERNGVLIDSSVFWKYPGNRLDGLGFPHNRPSHRGRLAEVPVTAYQREDRPNIFGSAFAPIATLRKFDVNWFTDAGEVNAAIDAAVEADVPVLVLFLHSFSLIEGRADGVPVADRHALDMFRAMLARVRDKNLQVVTMRELAGERLPEASSGLRDNVPSVAVPVDWPHYAWRRGKGLGRKSLAATAGLGVLSAFALLVLARRRRTAGQGPNAATVPAADAWRTGGRLR